MQRLLVIAVGVAIFFFGSNFVPLKNVTIKNFGFFQWVMCNAILLTALPWCLHSTRDAIIHPIPMIGGMLWCLGNYLCPFIINRLGLGVGTLLWGTVEMFTAWLSGNFGILGVKKQIIQSPTLNFIGIIFIVIGGAVLSFIKVEQKAPKQHQDNVIISATATPYTPMAEKKSPTASTSYSISIKLNNTTNTTDTHVSIAAGESSNNSNTYRAVSNDEENSDLKESDLEFVPNENNYAISNSELVTPSVATATTASPNTGPNPYAEGVLLSIMAGILFGVNFNPTQYVIDHSEGTLTSSDFIVSHYAGICYTSYVIYIVSVFHSQWSKRNTTSSQDQIHGFDHDAVVPAMIAGFLWGIAAIAWFCAAETLPLSVTFPLISAGPSLITTCWSVFVFHEIKQPKDLMILGIAMSFLLVGLTAVWWSNE